MKLNIVIDENISLAEEAFSQFGNVKLYSGREITNDKLKNADALIVRSITKVNEELLKGTPVKFVGTATIGTDHIDKDYLKKNNIYFSDAAGCNSHAVAEYVFTSLFYLAKVKNISLKNKTIGVAGIGNIGSKVVKLAEAFGMKVLKNDPPLKRKTNSNDFVSLDEILKADIISFHVPLNKEGIDKTVHLLDENKLKQIKEDAILINASRGEVIDNSALLQLLKHKRLNVILDVWENEPNVNTELLEKIDIATPHIAGYSLEGKVNGTKIIYNALCAYLNSDSEWAPKLPIIEKDKFEFNTALELKNAFFELTKNIYDIKSDDLRMRKTLELTPSERGKYFDKMRKEYPFRREFSNYKVELTESNKNPEEVLKAFRFNI